LYTVLVTFGVFLFFLFFAQGSARIAHGVYFQCRWYRGLIVVRQQAVGGLFKDVFSNSFLEIFPAGCDSLRLLPIYKYAYKLLSFFNFLLDDLRLFLHWIPTKYAELIVGWTFFSFCFFF